MRKIITLTGALATLSAILGFRTSSSSTGASSSPRNNPNGRDPLILEHFGSAGNSWRSQKEDQATQAEKFVPRLADLWRPTVTRWAQWLAPCRNDPFAELVWAVV